MSRSLSLQALMRVGQLQLLRQRMQYQLQVSGNLNVKQVYCSLEVVNKLTSMLLAKKEDFEEFAYDVSTYSEPFGISDPLSKIYITLKPIQHLPLLLALGTLHQLKKLSFSKTVGSLICKKPTDGVDGMPFVIGVSTFLTQLHPGQTLGYLAYICQYLNSYILQMGNSILPKKDEEFGASFYFIKYFLRYHFRKDSDKLTKLLIPSYEMIPSLINLIS